MAFLDWLLGSPNIAAQAAPQATPSGAPAYVAFDPTLSANPDAVGYQQGCPPGYAMEFTPLGADLSIPDDAAGGSGTTTGVRCILTSVATPDRLASDSSSTSDQALIALAAGLQTFVQKVKDAAGSLGPLYWIIGLGVAGYLYLRFRR